MNFKPLLLGAAGIAALTVASLAPAHGQQTTPGKNQQVRFPCGAGFVHNDRGPVNLFRRAAFRNADVPTGHLRISFVGHSTFLIQSPQKVKVITDYNDNYRADVLPDIATMNIQRGNHSTDFIDPSIKYVLRGWQYGTGIKRHDVTMKDVRVYNLPTNYLGTGPGGGFGNDSSMFVIQSSGICVSHMGHLAHTLNAEQFSRIGKIDVLMIPIDGRVTQSFDELVHNVKGIAPRIIIPMHFNVYFSAEEFISLIKPIYPVKRLKGNTIEVSKAALPQKTEVWFLPSQDLQEPPGSQL